MNRTRRLLAQIGQGLASAGIGSWLPDLPGTGDSPLATEAMSWDGWRVALAELSAHIGTPHLFAVRGGALLVEVGPVRSRYLLAPVRDGARLWRELLRARVAADADPQTTVASLDAAAARGETLELSGYRIPAALGRALAQARLPEAAVPIRTVSLIEDGADLALEGPPVWRQSSPVPADALALALANDITGWIRTCDARC